MNAVLNDFHQSVDLKYHVTGCSFLAPEPDPGEVVEPTFDELQAFIDENRPEEEDDGELDVWYPWPNRQLLRGLRRKPGEKRESRSRIQRKFRKRRTGGCK